LVLLLAAGSLPIDVTPAEAGRVKFRYRSHTAAKHHNKTDEVSQERSRSPIRLRFGRSSSSGSSSPEEDYEKARARPVGAAAAAAARAKAALEAEQARSAKTVTVYEPVPAGKTTDYAGGVTCVAGCE
jgi:hypothetical protein